MYIYNNVQSNRMSEKVNTLTEQIMLKPNEWMDNWKVENVSKGFFSMYWEEKIASQLYDGNKRDLLYLPDACKTQKNEEWLQKKMCASKQEILETMKFMHNTEDSDEDSHDSMH